MILPQQDNFVAIYVNIKELMFVNFTCFLRNIKFFLKKMYKFAEIKFTPMKNKFLLLGVVLFSSCTDRNPILTTSDEDFIITKVALDEIRSIDDAIVIALDVASINSQPSSRNDVSIANVVVVNQASNSRSSEDTLFYAVNYTNERGYALISANRNCDPVLAVVENGEFTSEDDIENPGMKLFLNSAKNYNLSVIPGGPILPPSPENPKMKDWIYENINDSVAPRVIPTFGNYSSRPIIACNAIAAAHALSVFEKPDTIYISKENKFQAINWYAYKHLSDPICVYETENCYTFIEELAIRMGANPQTGESYFHNNHKVIKTFLPNNVGEIRTGKPDPYNLIKSSGVIILDGFTTDNNGSIISPGHTWVIDGYIFRKIIDIEYIVTIDRFTGREISRVLSYDNSRVLEYLVHYNWGWNGDCNGYFNQNVFNPSYGTYYDRTNTNTHNKGYGANISYFVVK